MNYIFFIFIFIISYFGYCCNDNLKIILELVKMLFIIMLILYYFIIFFVIYYFNY
jgi:hypothetical protein